MPDTSRGFTLIEILVVIAIVAIVSSIMIYSNSSDVTLAAAERALKEVDSFSDALVKEVSKEASIPVDNVSYGGYFEHAVDYASCGFLDGNLLVQNLCVGGVPKPNKIYSVFPNIGSVLPQASSSVYIVGVSRTPGTISSADYRAGLDLNSVLVKITTQIKLGKVPEQNLASVKDFAAKILAKYGASSPDLATWTGHVPYITVVLEKSLANLRDISLFKNYLSLRVKPSPPSTAKDFFNIRLPLFEQYIYMNVRFLSSPKKTVYVVWAPPVGGVVLPSPTMNNYSEATVPPIPPATVPVYNRVCIISNMIYDENSLNCVNTSLITEATLSEEVAKIVYNEFVKLGFATPVAPPPASYRGLLVEPSFKVKKYHRFY